MGDPVATAPGTVPTTCTNGACHPLSMKTSNKIIEGVNDCRQLTK